MKYTKSLLLAALLPAMAVAADRDGAPAAGLQRIQQADLREGISYLASDQLDGRMSLQPGDDQAIAWVAKAFQQAGLQPIGTDGHGHPGYLQAVPLIEYRADAKASYLELTVAGQTRRLSWADAHGALPFARTAHGDLVFAGYGITAPELGYDDYAHIDVRGKIVVLFEHEPRETDPASPFNGTGNTRYATAYVKVLNAQKHGAIGVLFAGEPEHNHPTVEEIRDRIGHRQEHAANPIPLQALADQAVQIPSMSLSPAVAAELLAHTGQSALQLQQAIDQGLKPLSQPLASASATLKLQPTDVRRGISYNVVGLLPGSDPKLKSDTIIISGHHDHDGESGGKIWHGADDNASGTVGVVELARAFTAAGHAPKRSILFAVFAAEERGLLGAYYLAAHPLRPLATTRAMINFDMIGRDETPSPQTAGLIDVPANTHNRLNLIGAAYSPDYARTVAAANHAVGLDLDDRFDHEYALNVFFRSDQFPFVLHNIPAFWWFTGFHPDYHHPTDTPEKINYPKMQKILQLAYLSGWAFADETTPPRFVAAPKGQSKDVYTAAP
ncbi:M20/M25/M40 family metallo-hydrolase [Frateuria aurantia]